MLDNEVEWARARQVIESGDDKILDLRKVGFSFVTGLITASAFLGGKDFIAAAGLAYASIAVSVVALLAIACLRFCEKEINLRQEAAAFRADVIERFSSVELTGSLRDRSHSQDWRRNQSIVYSLYLAAAAVLGIASQIIGACTSGASGWLDPKALGHLVGALVIAVTALVMYVGMTRLSALRATKAFGDWRRGKNTDWSLSAWSASPEGTIYMQIANLGEVDDYIPFSDAGRETVVARLVPISGNVAQAVEITLPSEWSRGMSMPGCYRNGEAGRIPDWSERTRMVNSCVDWSAHAEGATPPGNIVNVVSRTRWLSDTSAKCECLARRGAKAVDGIPRWLLPARKSVCLPIRLPRAEGWYDVIVGDEGILRRRLHIQQSGPDLKEQAAGLLKTIGGSLQR